MNENVLTISGNVVAEPRHVITTGGLAITSFRMASTERRFDRGSQTWVDGETSWFTVSCFRSMAENVAESISKGQRVLVQGRLRMRDWTSGERSGTTAEIDAYAVGHDLAFGTSAFTRRSRVEKVVEPGRAEADELADAWLADGDEPPEPEAPAPEGKIPATAAR